MSAQDKQALNERLKRAYRKSKRSREQQERDARGGAIQDHS